MIQVVFDKVNKTYYAGGYLTGFVRLRGVEGRAHSAITGRAYGGIKYGSKNKDPNVKGGGFSHVAILETIITIAQEGVLFGFVEIV